MTYLLNNPADFAKQAVAGLAGAYPGYLTEVHGGVVRSVPTPEGQPALVIGGGSGHYPAFAGWVGPGMGHGAPCGNIFASPSASQVYSVAKSAENGGGVILGFGNYAGDVLHFGVAAEKLRAEGIDVRIIRVSDDVASNSPENHRDRRGIAGDLPVFKIAGAAIQAGANIEEAERIAWKANDATRSFGFAFDGCTIPGADEPLFRVPEGQMAIGLGIHGEPGIREEPMRSARDIADLLYEGVIAEQPPRGQDGYTGRVAVILNGLGTVKYEELFVTYGRVLERVKEDGLTPIGAEVGEFVTSLDMAGLSLTLVYLDEELEKYWTAPVDTPAFRRDQIIENPAPRTDLYQVGADPIPPASAESREAASSIAELLGQIRDLMEQQEGYLGKIDAVAGDGDHGQGMSYGSRGAADTAREVVAKGAGARTVLVQAGASWSEAAGGTSGALWGAALTAAGAVFSDDAKPSVEQIPKAILAGIGAVERLGGAKIGDKTMMDAAVPYRQAIQAGQEGADSTAQLLADAAAVAKEKAEATANIAARLGRARVLGDKSLGTPDPGAVSFAMIVQKVADFVK